MFVFIESNKNEHQMNKKQQKATKRNKTIIFLFQDTGSGGDKKRTRASFLKRGFLFHT
jgi:hypothetical protein